MYLNRLEVNFENKPCYDIVIYDDFSDLKNELSKFDIENRKICIVTDSNVAEIYLDKVKEELEGLKVFTHIFEAGEQNKHLETVSVIYDTLIINKFDRKDILLALGGGVVGDSCGFAAATYLRGIDFVQIPTTLVSQVDSSIGGKTGVDFKHFKNMVGAFYMPKLVYVNINTLKYQVPGGMLSNLINQLKEAGKEDKYREVLEEIPRVRKDFGEPPLVTPSSQIVGTQAVMNVLSGERYKLVPKESKKIMLGEFGQTIKPFNKEVQKKIIGDEKPITCRPADLIPPQLPEFEKKVAQWKEQDEDVLTYALFPKVAEEFFEYRAAQKTKVDITKADKEAGAYPV